MSIYGDQPSRLLKKSHEGLRWPQNLRFRYGIEGRKVIEVVFQQPASGGEEDTPLEVVWTSILALRGGECQALALFYNLP